MAAEERRIRVWDAPLRVFHWALAVAVTVAIVTGREGGEWMAVHGIAGFVIIGLVAFRLIWGFVGSTHARFVSFAPTPSRVVAYLRGRWQGVGHNPLGALSVLAMLALLGVQAATGLFGNDDIGFAGPFASRIDDELSAWLTGWHHRLGDVLLILIGLHLVAIAFYVLVRKRNLVGPMFSGRQRSADGEAGQGGGGGAFAVALAVGVAAGVAASGVWEGAAPAAATPAANGSSGPAASPPPAPPAW